MEYRRRAVSGTGMSRRGEPNCARKQQKRDKNPPSYVAELTGDVGVTREEKEGQGASLSRKTCVATFLFSASLLLDCLRGLRIATAYPYRGQSDIAAPQRRASFHFPLFLRIPVNEKPVKGGRGPATQREKMCALSRYKRKEGRAGLREG